jgi:hypothetical protein
VAQQFLHDAQVGPAVEQVRREAVAEGVGRDTLRQPGSHTQSLETEPDSPHRKGGASMVEKEDRGIIGRSLRLAARVGLGPAARLGSHSA